VAPAEPDAEARALLALYRAEAADLDAAALRLARDLIAALDELAAARALAARAASAGFVRRRPG
jgi:hypothetical protein